MLRLLADQNFNEDIISGLLDRRPDLDVIHARDVGLQTAKDPGLLAWAAQEDRILLTHDHKTVPDFAYDRVRAGVCDHAPFTSNRKPAHSAYP
jgi:predicted nuclease of predicted toxin-antitoxin system